MIKKIRSHRDLDVYKRASDGAMRVFELSKRFPAEERYSLTDQIRRASRSVCSNLAKRGASAAKKIALNPEKTNPIKITVSLCPTASLKQPPPPVR